MKKNVNLGLTVNELLEECKKQIQKGNGNKHIIISNDDEGNGFHTLFYSFTDQKEDLKYILLCEHDKTHTVNNCVCLG